MPSFKFAVVVAASSLLSSAALAGAKGGDGAGGEKNYLRMKKAALIDQHGFERPIPAATLLVPSDWKVESEVEYYKPGSCTLSGLKFRATGADGRMLELFPNYNWNWSDDRSMVQFLQNDAAQKSRNGARVCGVRQPTPAAEFLRGVIPQLLPRYQIVSIEPLTDLSQKLQAGARQTEANYPGMKVMTEAARARLTGTSPEGKPVEAWLTAIVSSTGTGQQGHRYWQNEGRFLYAFRAPQGRLDASLKLYETMISSARLDPDWVARTNHVTNQIHQTEAKGAADRQRIRQQTQKDIAAIRKSSNDYRAASQDHTAKQNEQYLRGTETYKDSNTGEQVELSSQYGHAWKSASGEYLLSDSPNFDPNTVSDQTWNRMEHADP